LTLQKLSDRIIGLYPKSEEQVIRTRSRKTFRYIISQRLIPRAEGARGLPAVEFSGPSRARASTSEAGETQVNRCSTRCAMGSIDGMQDSTW